MAVRGGLPWRPLFEKRLQPPTSPQPAPLPPPAAGTPAALAAAGPCDAAGYTYYALKTSKGGDIYTDSSLSTFVLGTNSARDDVTPTEMAAACNGERPGCVAFDSFFNFKSSVALQVSLGLLGACQASQKAAAAAVRAVVAALFGAADPEMAPSLIGPPVLAASPAGPVDIAVQRQAADPGVPRSVGGNQHDRQPAQGEAAWWTLVDTVVPCSASASSLLLSAWRGPCLAAVAGLCGQG